MNGTREQRSAVGRGAPATRHWTAEEKLRIIVDAQRLQGEKLEALLQREGLQQAQVDSWRQALLGFLAELPLQGDLGSSQRARRRREARDRWQLEQELRRGKREQAEARVLLKILESRAAAAGRRRQRYAPRERQQVLALVSESSRAGARLKQICAALGLSARTVQRWRAQARTGALVSVPRRNPANRLSDAERARIMSVLQSEEYQGHSPRQIVPRLADQGIYLASESTMYRLLRATPRQAPKRSWARSPKPTSLIVDAPNHVWCWDITQLKSSRRGAPFHLYLVMDAFSRRIMGWEVYERQCMQYAARFIRRTCEMNGLKPRGLLLHSDNGRPMKGLAMFTTLDRLGIIASFNRPYVHDDNPLPEALFRTLKGRPTFPRLPFESLEVARQWVEQFVTWYNGQHRHSALCFVTPDDRYFGREGMVLARRRAVYERGRAEQPLRWTGRPREWRPAGPLRIQVRPWLQPDSRRQFR